MKAFWHSDKIMNLNDESLNELSDAVRNVMRVGNAKDLDPQHLKDGNGVFLSELRTSCSTTALPKMISRL